MKDLDVDAAAGAAGSTGTGGASSTGCFGNADCPDGQFCPPGPHRMMGEPPVCRPCGPVDERSCLENACVTPGTCNADFDCEQTCTESDAPCACEAGHAGCLMKCAGGCASQQVECRGPVRCMVDCTEPGSCIGMQLVCFSDTVCQVECSAEGCDESTMVTCGDNECTVTGANVQILLQTTDTSCRQGFVNAG